MNDFRRAFTKAVNAEDLFRLAMEQDLTIIPVLNKVDLPAADVPRVSKQVMRGVPGTAMPDGAQP